MSMSNPQPSDDLDIGAYVAGVRRQKWMIVAAAIIGVVLGLTYALVKTPSYTATATVQINPPTSGGSSSSSSSGMLSTEEIVAHSNDVATVAAGVMGSGIDPSTLLKHLTVSRGVGDANVLDFKYSSTSATLAATGANAFAHGYVSYKEQQQAQAYKDLQSSIQPKIDQLNNRIDAINRRLAAAPPNSGGHQADRAALDRYSTQVSQYTDILNAALPDATAPPAQVVQDATAPSTPTSPVPAIDAFAGFLLGLFAGIVIALFRSRRGDRWRPATDLEGWLAAPVLGTIPKTSDGLEVVTVTDPASPAAEAYRKLRARLFMIGHGTSTWRTLMVTSAAAEDVKSVVATNLAVTLGQAGKRTILVSADFRRPGVERLLQLRSSPGFCEVLSGESPLSMALQPSGVHDLWILASGRSSSADIDVLHSGSIDEFLRASDLVDYVIIDAAPLVSVADALVIAGSVDGVVIAADGRSVKREDAIRAREELEQVGARLLGSIVTNAPKVRASAAYPRSRQEPAGAKKKKKKKQKKSEGAAGGFSPDRPTGVVTGAQAEPNGRKADEQDDAQAWLERTENAPGQDHPVAR